MHTLFKTSMSGRVWFFPLLPFSEADSEVTVSVGRNVQPVPGG